MASNSTKQSGSTAALIGVLMMFFFWGFIAASNGVMIPVFRQHFSLTQFQSQLIDFAFYIAYFVGSGIYYFMSVTMGDPLNKIGYRMGMVLGLCASACGALLFLPAIAFKSYNWFLTGYFAIGLGFALLQIVANPFVINLGNPAQGASRLNFAGGINSLGTTIGPVLMAYILFGRVGGGSAPAIALEQLQIPYVVLAGMLLLLAGLMFAIPMPPSEAKENHSGTTQSIWAYPQLIGGMVAIFVYVGTEVTIQSNMGALLQLPEIKGISADAVDKYISLYWGSLMIGRMSSVFRSVNISNQLKAILQVVVPFAVLGLVWGVNILRGSSISDMYIYAVWIVLFIIVNYIGQEKPAKTLLLFGITAMLLMLIGIFMKGDIALYCFLSGGLFCSVMWPCIFNLAIAGLGSQTHKGSSLLIMMILGGAIIPPLQGKLADVSGIHISYIVPLVGFAFLAWYGYAAKGILAKQGISYEGDNIEQSKPEFDFAKKK